MSKQQASTKDQEMSTNAKTVNAEWHPYSVWKSTIRQTNQHADNEPSKIEAHPSWDPFAVWKRHIKRG